MNHLKGIVAAMERYGIHYVVSVMGPAPGTFVLDNCCLAGIIAMEGQGPIRGPSRPLGWLVAGAEPIACELICCGLIGMAPETVPIIRTAKQIGFGCADPAQIEVVGDAPPTTPCLDFVMPRLTPIKFSFTQICRSVGKQILLLTAGSRNREVSSIRE